MYVFVGCEPYWLQPEVDPDLGIPHCIAPSTLETALQSAKSQGKKVAGVLVVSPTYFGVCADIAGQESKHDKACKTAHARADSLDVSFVCE